MTQEKTTQGTDAIGSEGEMPADSFKKVDEATYELEIDIGGDDIKREEEKQICAFAKTVSIPGFRRGRAPMSLVRARLDKEALRREVLESLMRAKLDSSLNEFKQRIFGSPSIETLEDTPDHYRAKVVVQVVPDLDVSNFTKEPIKIDLDLNRATESEVENQLKYFDSHYAPLVEVERPVKESDYVEIRVNLSEEFKGKIEGFKGDFLVVNVRNLVPSLKNKILGEKSGSIIEVEIDLEGGLNNPDSGEKLEFAPEKATVMVLRVFEQSSIEYNDDWVMDNTPFLSQDEFKNMIKKRAKVYSLVKALEIANSKIIDRIRGLSGFVVPSAIFEFFFNLSLEDLAERFGFAPRSFKEFFSKLGNDRQKILLSRLADDGQRLATRYILAVNLIKKDVVKLSEETLNKYLIRFARLKETDTKEQIRSKIDAIGELALAMAEIETAFEWVSDNMEVEFEDNSRLKLSGLSAKILED